MIQFTQHVLAHPSSQEGVLAKTYHETYDGYYIGGENIGWSIDEMNHTNGNVLTYSFSSSDPFLSDIYKSLVAGGANQWSGTITIINKTDGSGTGEISTYNNPNQYALAEFCDYSSDNSGHLTSWKIRINRAQNATATTLAHEFGHAIGLNDLYEDQNINKLMYGYSNSAVTSPTQMDQWGAKVIIGSHTSHAWRYKYWKSNSIGNMHIKYCVKCNGLSLITEQCTYGTSNYCTKCGTSMHQVQ